MRGFAFSPTRCTNTTSKARNYDSLPRSILGAEPCLMRKEFQGNVMIALTNEYTATLLTPIFPDRLKMVEAFRRTVDTGFRHGRMPGYWVMVESFTASSADAAHWSSGLTRATQNDVSAHTTFISWAIHRDSGRGYVTSQWAHPSTHPEGRMQ